MRRSLALWVCLAVLIVPGSVSAQSLPSDWTGHVGPSTV